MLFFMRGDAKKTSLVSQQKNADAFAGIRAYYLSKGLLLSSLFDDSPPYVEPQYEVNGLTMAHIGAFPLLQEHLTLYFWSISLVLTQLIPTDIHNTRNEAFFIETSPFLSC